MRGRMRLRSSAAALWLALGVEAALGQQPAFSPALGDGGRWGAPYGWVGPQGAAVWEEYRKAWDDHVPPYPNTVASDAGAPGQVSYLQVRQGYDTAGLATFHAPGTFIGPSVASRSPPGASVQLLAASAGGIDLRLAFAEHLGSDGGAPLSAFVSNEGGDDGRMMDPYYGNWGVDGMEVHFVLDSTGTDWRTLSGRSSASLVASASSLWEPSAADSGRTEYWGEVVFDAGTVDGGFADLGTPTSQPLQLSWRVSRSDAGTVFQGSLGASASFSWLFDDGALRHGLTNPGNRDGVPYQGGALDVTALVPMLFVCAPYQGMLDNLPAVELTLGVAGETPRIEDLSNDIVAGVPTAFSVTAVDTQNAVVTTYAQTIGFSSTDTNATLPADYTFAPQDMGTHAFVVTFRTPGLQALTVRDVETPVIASTQQPILITGLDGGVTADAGLESGPAARYSVGCDCNASPGAGLLWAALLMAVGRAVPRR
jgi:hypothetical protein